MTNNLGSIPLPRPRLSRSGVDAPSFVFLNGPVGVGCCVASDRRRWGPVFAEAVAGAAPLATTSICLHTTLRGMLRIRVRELDRIGLKRRQARVLDPGSGRRAVLIEAAKRLPARCVNGVDVWSGREQRGNSLLAALAHAVATGVVDRVKVNTAAMTDMPFADRCFDVVTSALAIHNIPKPEGRCRAVSEAMRVLRPGGAWVIADFWWAAPRHVERLGAGTPRPLGGPWIGISLPYVIMKQSPARAESC